MSIPTTLSDFQEIEPPQLHIGGRNQSYATRTFKCGWNDVSALSYVMLGVWSGTRLIAPAAHFPGCPELIASEIDATAFMNNPQTTNISDLNNSITAYSHAKVTVKFTQNSTDIPHPDGTSLEIRRDVSSEMITMPGNTLYWNGDTSKPLPADMTAGFLIGSTSIEMNWSKVPSPPWSAIETCESCVNSSTFCNVSAGKLLFVGASDRTTYQYGQSPTHSLTYQFKKRSIDWRKLYHKDNNFDYATDSAGNKILSAVDFNQLFAFG